MSLWCRRNPDLHAVRMRKYRAENRDACVARVRAWREQNRGAERVARKLGIGVPLARKMLERRI